MIAFVREVTAEATAVGSISKYSRSQSTRTGRAPILATAPAEATNELAGTTTSSPASTPTARSASSRASVPLATPTACADLQYEAQDSSNRATWGPPMNE